MTVRSCKVTIKDLDGVVHTADVTAQSLYEAVALGMAAIQGIYVPVVVDGKVHLYGGRQK